MKKFIVMKRVYATQFVLVKAEDEIIAIENVDNGEGILTGSELLFNGNRPLEYWDAEQIEASDEEFDAYRLSALASQDLDDLKNCETIEDMLDEFE